MKSSDTNSFASSVPSLFQIAAFFEDFFPSREPRQSVAPVSHLPIADFMLNPEKLMRLLRTEKGSNEAGIVMSDPSQSPVKRAARNGSSKKPGGTGRPNSSPPGNGSSGVSKKVEFTFKSPSAGSVKLAGDFTNWDKRPVEMMPTKEGLWSAVVPLAPGVYSYRFIVDGQWCDDPRSGQRIPNPFGTENAVIQVV